MSVGELKDLSLGQFLDQVRTLDASSEVLQIGQHFDLNADFQLRSDSQSVAATDGFIAIRGTQFDGHSVLSQVLLQEPSCLILENHSALSPEVLKVMALRSRRPTVIAVQSTRYFLAQYASFKAQFPSRDLKTIGVTGTNGKTTTTYLLEHLLNGSSERTGVIGTIEHRLGTKVWPTQLTTPGPIEFHNRLKQFKDSGATAVALEASSHAIDQHRIAATEFDAAIWTSFSQDHLDYHGTAEHYFISKAKLFTHLLEHSKKSNKVAVLNRSLFQAALDLSVPESVLSDFRSHLSRLEAHGVQVYFYSAEQEAESCGRTYWMNVRAVSQEGLRFTLDLVPQKNQDLRLDSARESRTKELLELNSNREFHLPMIGLYNGENAVAAILVALHFQKPIQLICDRVESFPGLSGRLERVSIQNRVGLPAVFVDFAHTDHGLLNVLTSIQDVRRRSKSNGRIITVFGCGGDRDRTKRPKMGRVAAELSDLVIVTSDNPRSEQPESIIQDILSGIDPSLRTRTSVEVDRRKAIELAILNSAESDIVLIAGKGHEKTQTIGSQSVPFDDVEVARSAMTRLK